MEWQIHEVEQRFDEVLWLAQTAGAQTVTRDGEAIAVVISIEDYRRLKGATSDFKTLLMSGPFLDDIEIERSTELTRVFEWEPEDEASA